MLDIFGWEAPAAVSDLRVHDVHVDHQRRSLQLTTATRMHTFVAVSRRSHKSLKNVKMFFAETQIAGLKSVAFKQSHDLPAIIRDDFVARGVT